MMNVLTMNGDAVSAESGCGKRKPGRNRGCGANAR